MLSRCSENSTQRDNKRFPLAAAAFEHAMTFGGQLIDSSPSAAPAVLLAFPGCRDLTGLFQAVQRRIERAFLELKQAATADFEPAEDFQAVRFPPLQSREDQGLEVTA